MNEEVEITKYDLTNEKLLALRTDNPKISAHFPWQDKFKDKCNCCGKKESGTQ